MQDEILKKQTRWDEIESKVDNDIRKVREEIQRLSNLQLSRDSANREQDLLEVTLSHQARASAEQQRALRNESSNRVANSVEKLWNTLSEIEDYRDCSWGELWIPLLNDVDENPSLSREYRERQEARLARKIQEGMDKAARAEANQLKADGFQIEMENVARVKREAEYWAREKGDRKDGECRLM